MLSWFKRQPIAPVAQAYVRGTPRRVNRTQPIADLTFAVLDAETTGLDLNRDRMLAVALVEVKDGQIDLQHSASWLVRQTGVGINAAVAVHGILPHDTATGRAEIEVLEELLPRLTGAVLVGHHIGFDAQMLDQAFRRHFRIRLRNPLLDTARMAMSGIDAFRKTGYANQRPPSLDELCAHTGLPIMARHTAEGDAFTTAQLFLLLCGRLRRRLNRDLRAEDLPLAR